MIAMRPFTARFFATVMWIVLALFCALLFFAGFWHGGIGEALGALFLGGVFGGTAILNLFILFSTLLVGSVHTSLKIGWFAVMLLVLVLLALSIIPSQRDCDIVAAYLLVYLSFPIGLAVVLIAASISTALRADLSAPLFMLVVLVALGLGYWQWFWLLPRLVRWRKKRLAQEKQTID